MVSIIIPNYNYGRFLEDTFRCVLAQTYSDWECIVVDNSSEDNSREIIEKYCNSDSRFKYFLKKNNGPSAARNTGLQKATGEFIQFLDADDLLEADKLKVCVSELENNPQTDVAYTDVKYFSQSIDERRNSIENLSNQHKFKVEGRGDVVVNALLRGNIFVINSPLFRKRLIDKCGSFDDQLKTLEDWDLWLRFAVNDASFKFIKAENTLALVRSHENSLSRNSEAMQVSYLPVLLKNYSVSSLSVSQQAYFFIRFEEQFLNAIFIQRSSNTLKNLFDAAKRYSKNATLVSLIIFSIPFLPLYFILKIYRFIQSVVWK